jgi:endonuclease/exonuclease/phosphatase family metal-dependent hydrolase
VQRCAAGLAFGLVFATAVAAGAGSDSSSAACRVIDATDGIITGDTLDVVTLNIAHARGTAFNQLFVTAARHRQNLKEIAVALTRADADVVALQEADAASLWSGRFDHVEFLSGETGYDCHVHGHHADTWLYNFGTALLSRVPMSATASHAFRPSPPTTTKGLVRGTIAWRTPGEDSEIREITLVSVHLDFSRKSVREAQVAEIVTTMSDHTGPLILLGDMNEDWKSEDSVVKRVASVLGLRAFAPDASELGTYEQSERIDWILISEELRFVDFASIPDVVSDHRGLVARIGWAGEQ